MAGDDDWDDDEDDCSTVERIAVRLLDGLHDHKDRTRLVSDLIEAGHRYAAWGTGEGMLLAEAYAAAKRGDVDDAILRLERIASPKFYSTSECQEQYEAAMAEKREREAA